MKLADEHALLKRNRAALASEVCELSTLMHAATAELARVASAFAAADAWDGDGGFRSAAHWLSLHVGFDMHTSAELIRVGDALQHLPAVAAAFAAGELSYDKVRSITRVASAADEAVWLDLAREASGSQLIRICHAYRRVERLNAPQTSATHLARRGMSWFWDDDGMLRLTAVLPPEDGAAVLAAVERVVRRDAASQPPRAGLDITVVADPAESPFSAHRADALVALCADATAWDAGHAATAAATATPQLVVHVDVGVLTGDDPEGRAHLDNGPALSTTTALRLGCDADVVTITERDGLPIDVGRNRRIVSTRLRRAVQSRDQGCRFPGCTVPVQRTHAHHIEHWAHGGPTVLANLLALCHFHHRRLHDGTFRIRRDGNDIHFETIDGIVIRPGPRPDHPVAGTATLRTRITAGAPIDPDAAWAHDGGRLDLGYTVMTIIAACDSANAEADGPGP